MQRDALGSTKTLPKRFPKRGLDMVTTLKGKDDVFRLALPKAPRLESAYFDAASKDRAKGLALRVRADGSRTWAFYYRFGGKQRRLTIGPASDDPKGWTLAKARSRARELRVALDTGIDPAADRKRKEAEAAQKQLLLSAVVDDYLAARQEDMKPRSHVEWTRLLTQHWKPLHKLMIGAVNRQIIAAHLRTIAKDNGPFAANRARGALSAIFAWAIGEGLCDSNPVIGTNKPTEEKPRERVLDDAELAAVWKAAPDNDYGRIVKLLMLTGQRRDEIGSLCWSEIDFDARTIKLDGARTKNSRAHVIPLSDDALAILQGMVQVDDRQIVFGRGRGGFAGWSKGKLALDQACGIKCWVLHDLRRTAATRMAESGVLPHVIEAVLNHISGHKSGVAGVYNRSTYEPEKRAALDTLASYIKTAIAKSEGANVHRLNRKPA
jgi:integrase